MTRLGITREANRITDLMKLAQSKGIEIIPLPLTKTSHTSFDKPDLDTFDWAIFSSQQGVESFFNRLNSLNLDIPGNMKFAVVGDKTEKALESFSQKAEFKPSDSYGKILFEEFVAKFGDKKINVLYVRAEFVNFEPDKLFDNSSINFTSLIAYKTESNNIDIGLIDKFNRDDYIFFTAPSTVDSFNEQFGKPKSKIIAIGKTTAEKMTENNWNNLIIMDKADINKVLEYI
jgi:uroporphyrinogen-III synthase